MSSKVAPLGEGEESFQPKFDGQGLLTAVAVEIDSGQVLMVAFMNAEAVEATRTTRRATFFSRSRNKLWVKGESSGNFLSVEEILVDCDEDCLILKVRLPAKGVACHTGEKSCFYRKLNLVGAAGLKRIAI
jgi:phosphoribosyl-AMP cyclohydrolase